MHGHKVCMVDIYHRWLRSRKLAVEINPKRSERFIEAASFRQSRLRWYRYVAVNNECPPPLYSCSNSIYYVVLGSFCWFLDKISL